MNWQKVKFGDVVWLNTERCADPVAEGIERYVGLEHLTPGDLRVRTWGLVAEGTTFTNLFWPGQVLFGKRRAYQRKVAVAEFTGVCSGDIYVFESHDPERLLPELLPFICQTERFFEHAVGTSAGSLSPRTNWTQLAEYEFALPPLDEQHQIVELLVASADSLESLHILESQAEKVYLSLVLHLFQNGIGNHRRAQFKHLNYPADWHLQRVDECFHMQLGKMSSAIAREGPYQKAYLKNNNVLWGEFDFAELSAMSFNEVEQEKFSLQKGDLLVCEGGEIGRAAVWKEQYPGLYYQKALHRLRAKSNDHLTEFMMHYLRYCAMRGILKSIATGTTLLHLPEEQLAALKLPFPSQEEQKEIVEVLNNAKTTQNRIGDRLNLGLQRHHSLLMSLLTSRGIRNV